MASQNQTRRGFLIQAGTGAGFGWVARTFPALLSLSEVACRAQQDNAPFITFTPEEAADFEALAAQIIPSGDTPGAREAGVVYFADLALTQIEAVAPMLTPLRQGLADLRKVAEEKTGNASFAQLSDAEQKEVIGAIEKQPYFSTARTLTVFGFFSHPKYGGNRDKVGWQVAGLEDRPAWQPPFGYYDVDYDYEADYGEDG